jgi:hypothetical protein
MRNRTKNPWIWWAGAAVAGAALARWQLARLFTEQPKYQLEAKLGMLEIRRYPPRWVAETRVQNSWDAALGEGFRRLARYIFGNQQRSRVQSPSSEKLAMTAPVNVRVGRGLVGTKADAAGASHVVSFNLPAGRTRESLPRPADERVTIALKPEARMAVLRYRGRRDGDTVAAKFLELLVALRRAGLRHRGNPQFAGYDPPSTLPLLRRNEVWIELEPATL